MHADHKGDAAAPRPLSPTGHNADAANVGRVTTAHGIESPDFDLTVVACKAVITMMAQAAQAGYTLHELAGGGYLLCRWGLAKELPCLRAVGDLLRRIGAAR